MKKNTKQINGNRLSMRLRKRMEYMLKRNKITVTGAAAYLFVHNFADTDTGRIVLNNNYYVQMNTLSLPIAFQTCLSLSRSSAYQGIKQLLDNGLIHYSEKERAYFIDEYILNDSDEWDAEKNKYFRVPFALFNTDILRNIIRSKKYKNILFLCDTFNLIAQHTAGYGNSKYFSDRHSELDFDFQELKGILNTNSAATVRNTILNMITPLFSPKNVVGYFKELKKEHYKRKMPNSFRMITEVTIKLSDSCFSTENFEKASYEIAQIENQLSSLLEKQHSSFFDKMSKNPNLINIFRNEFNRQWQLSVSQYEQMDPQRFKLLFARDKSEVQLSKKAILTNSFNLFFSMCKTAKHNQIKNLGGYINRMAKIATLEHVKTFYDNEAMWQNHLNKQLVS